MASRRRMLSLVVPFLAALCLLGACGEAERRPTPEDSSDEGVPASPPMTWTSGVPEAQALAKQRKRFLLVYVAWDSSWCVPCRLLEQRVFQAPGSAALASRCVAVKIPFGPQEAVEGLRLIESYRVRHIPTLLILAPDGHLLHRQVGHLFPITALGHEAPPRPQKLWTPADLVSALDAADARERQERPRLALLAGRSDPASLLEHARLLRDRAQWKEALALYGEARQQGADPEAGAELAALLYDGKQLSEAAQVLETLLQKHPTDARVPRWHLQRIGLHAPTMDGTAGLAEPDPEQTAALLRDLLAGAAKVGAHEIEARARLEQAGLHQRRGQEAEMRDALLWFDRDESGESPRRWLAADLNLRLLQLQRASGAKEAAAKTEAWLRHQHPNSTAYQTATHGLTVPIATDD